MLELDWLDMGSFVLLPPRPVVLFFFTFLFGRVASEKQQEDDRKVVKAGLALQKIK
jgi:hypothetical protein